MSVKRFGYGCEFDGNSGPFVKYEDYAALEARCAALAAENAGLKEEISNITFMRDDDFFGSTQRAQEVMGRLVNFKTPDTDAFLAEVRASAVEEFVRMADYSESVADGEVIVTSSSVFAAGHEYAAQLRKGVQP
ncbi:hypothetical protein MVR16_001671 [Escherichia coli]|nr:hypothetical protein [Escherichia coli]EJA4556989.1 hypothetical protein [Escherichia coli]